jgi:hypothetical protein
LNPCCLLNSSFLTRPNRIMPLYTQRQEHVSKTIYPVVYPVIFIDIPIKSRYIPLHSHWISYECVQNNYIPDIPRYIPMILPLIIPYIIIILCFSHVLLSRYPIVLLSHDPIIFPLNICHASRIPLLKIEEMPAHEYPHERYPINLHYTMICIIRFSHSIPIIFPNYPTNIYESPLNPLILFPVFVPIYSH